MTTQETIKTWLSRGEGTCNAYNPQHRAALVRGLHQIQDYQTQTERLSHTTREHNGVGWSAFDAPRAADLIFSISCGDLTVENAWRAKVLLRKYSKQLAAIKDKTSCSVLQ